MRLFILKIGIVLFSLLFITLLASAEEVLTNRSVERMVAAGLSPEIITAKIKSSKSDFDVSIDKILELKKKGIHDDIVKAMVSASADRKPAPPRDDYGQGNQYYEPGQQYGSTPYYSEPYRPQGRMNQIDKLLKDIEEAQRLKDEKNYLWKGKAHAISATIKSIYPSNTHNMNYWWAYTQFSVLVEKDHHILKGIKKVLYFDPYHQEALILKGDVNFRSAKKGNTNTKSRGRKKGSLEENKAELAWVAEKAYKAALDLPKISPERKAYVYFQVGDMAEEIEKSTSKAKQNWQLAIDEAPDSEWAAKAKERLGIKDEEPAEQYDPAPYNPSSM